MEDGIVQVDDENIDDVLDSTYKVLLLFCIPVRVLPPIEV